MTISSQWEHVSFHDAIVREQVMDRSEARLTLQGVYLLPAHPMNTAGKLYLITHAVLLFVLPVAVGCRAFSSEGGAWIEQVEPFPVINTIADVTHRGEEWQISGFERNGPHWLELTVKIGQSVVLFI